MNYGNTGRGGYQIVDLKEKPIIVGGGGVSIVDALNQVTNNNSKPFLLTGRVLKASSLAIPVKMNDEWVTFTKSGTNYVADTTDGNTVTISNTGNVSVAVQS